MSGKQISIKEFSALPEIKKCAPEVLASVTTEDMETLLNEHPLTPKVKNTISAELKNRNPNFVYDDVPEGEDSDDDKEYPALNFIAGVDKFIGWLFIIAGVISLIYFLTEGSVWEGILALVGSFVFALISFASAESIKVITDISSSAYRILQHLKDN